MTSGAGPLRDETLRVLQAEEKKLIGEFQATIQEALADADDRALKENNANEETSKDITSLLLAAGVGGKNNPAAKGTVYYDVPIDVFFTHGVRWVLVGCPNNRRSVQGCIEAFY